MAAGKGLRAGGERPKQLALRGGRAMVAHTVSVALEHPRLALVAVVVPADDPASVADALGDLGGRVHLVPGGRSRQQSVLNGLEALASLPRPPEAVLIQDAARPGWDAALIDRVIDALVPGGAVLPALPVTDTIWQRRADGTGLEPLDRSRLLAAQTPQGFAFPAILAAHRTHRSAEVTDDIALATLSGLPIAVVEGSPHNAKITTAQDLARWQAQSDEHPLP